MDEKTCCDECTMQCGEHDLRWAKVAELEQKVSSVEKRLEVGVVKFNTIETRQAIFILLVLAMFAVAGMGYARADIVKDTLNIHIGQGEGTKVMLQNIKEKLDRIEKKLEKP